MNRKLLVLAGLAVLAVAVVELHQPGRPHSLTSVSRTAFRSIEVGMTRGEVVAILGLPYDTRTMATEADFDPDDHFGTRDERVSSSVLAWRSDAAVVFVCFDESRKVRSGVYDRSRPSAECD
jgi:outer membrane protein assembly factor BamE (lipoprotein component of BamABCDE complex)